MLRHMPRRERLSLLIALVLVALSILAFRLVLFTT